MITQLINHRSVYSVLFYVLLIALIIVIKPSWLFYEDGQVRDFGLGTKQTVFSLGVIVVALAIVAYYIFAVIDILFSN
jgi:hypothetical protein